MITRVKLGIYYKERVVVEKVEGKITVDHEEIKNKKKKRRPKSCRRALKAVKEVEFGAVEITPRDEFFEMLKASIKNKKPLRLNAD